MTIDEYIELIKNNESVFVKSNIDNLINMHSVWSPDEILMMSRLFNDDVAKKMLERTTDDAYPNHKIIGDDALGNYILLNEASGEIVYWDSNYAYTKPDSHNEEYDDDLDMNPFNVIKLADSLSEFLAHVVVKAN